MKISLLSFVDGAGVRDMLARDERSLDDDDDLADCLERGIKWTFVRWRLEFW